LGVAGSARGKGGGPEGASVEGGISFTAQEDMKNKERQKRISRGKNPDPDASEG